MASDWILIADASRARVLQRQGTQPSSLVQAFEHAASRRHSSELGDAERGRQASTEDVLEHGDRLRRDPGPLAVVRAEQAADLRVERHEPVTHAVDA